MLLLPTSGEKVFLNTLIRDNNKITRYFHLCQAEIPFNICNKDKLIGLVNLLLTFRVSLSLSVGLMLISNVNYFRFVVY